MDYRRTVHDLQKRIAALEAELKPAKMAPLVVREVNPVVQFRTSMLRRVKVEKSQIIPSLDEYYTQIVRENKVKSRMFIQLQPSDPYTEAGEVIIWKDSNEEHYVDLEILNRVCTDQYQMFEKVKGVMDLGSVGQYSGREDVLLNLLS